MKYAIVDGVRREASRGLSGTCPVCDASMTPRIGRLRVAHWAHPPGIVDHRWEPETEWHRDWKARFPEGCQEVIHRAENGERHFADVKTVHGQVLEFQNSPISEEERRSREAIYQPMCWVVNGLRLKMDRKRFYQMLRAGVVTELNPLTIIVPMERCLLLRKWESSQRLVLFDFGEVEEEGDPLRFGAPVLWAVHPGRPTGQAVLMPVLRDRFVDAMINNRPLIGVKGEAPPAPIPRPHFIWPRRHRRL